MMDQEIAKLLDFTANKYDLKESGALELKRLLNSIPDEKLKDVVVCDVNGDKLDDVFFSRVGDNFQKAIIF